MRFSNDSSRTNRVCFAYFLEFQLRRRESSIVIEGLSKLHVLHLEDDPLQRRLVERGLKNAKFSVDSCSCIAEAMVLLNQFEFCVAVVDLELLGENGMELVRELVKRKSRTKLIVHTANATFESAKQGIDFGIFSYVEKAQGLAHLVEQVERAASAYWVESQSYAQRLAIIGQMANDLVHEINQPLCAISNYAGGLLLGLKNSNCSVEELIEVLTQIQHQTIRAGEIVGRLRSYGHRTKTRLAELDVNDVVMEAMKLIEFDFRENRVGVELALEASPLVAKGDRVQLIQVLVNVLKNAAESLSVNGTKNRQCYVTTTKIESDIQIEIRDHRTGGERGKRPGLLEPYYSTAEGGLGLSLSICKSIMDDHGGNIALEHGEFHGLIVRLRIPRGDC